MTPHTGSATSEQIETLLNFLNEHRDLARGRLRSVEGKLQAKRLWEELCSSLNSMGGCTKTVQQWQKVWFDRKHLAKKAASASRSMASATGGGPSTVSQLSHWELKVLEIMGDGFGERQTGASVPAFSETSESITSMRSTSVNQPSTSSQPITLDLPVESEYVEQNEESSQLAEPVHQPVSQEPLHSRHSSQTTRRHRRSASTRTSSSDVRSRLFQLEEGRVERENVRNEELAGIRAALQQLCTLMREYLDRSN